MIAAELVGHIADDLLSREPPPIAVNARLLDDFLRLSSVIDIGSNGAMSFSAKSSGEWEIA